MKAFLMQPCFWVSLFSFIPQNSAIYCKVDVLETYPLNSWELYFSFSFDRWFHRVQNSRLVELPFNQRLMLTSLSPLLLTRFLKSLIRSLSLLFEVLPSSTSLLHFAFRVFSFHNTHSTYISLYSQKFFDAVQAALVNQRTGPPDSPTLWMALQISQVLNELSTCLWPSHLDSGHLGLCVTLTFHLVYIL